jgi:D-serine deaminase-like pyridoxal phosphate-dependent protein
MENQHWFVINEADKIDSPALCIYKERIRKNIRLLLETVPAEKVRPHVKTNKMAEVCQLMMDAGISKFKSATIAEAEMLGMVRAKDVLLAYPLTGPKIMRFLSLIKKYPATRFSCLVDSPEGAAAISEYFITEQRSADVFIDLNVGLNRTGILPERTRTFYETIRVLKGIRVIGLHAYDGHIHDQNLQTRRHRCLKAFEEVPPLKKVLESLAGYPMTLVAGGSPTYLIHAQQGDRECSPGTFVFWDKGYTENLPEQPFACAALLLCRVISIPAPHTVCVDLGYKSVAAENPQPRVFFLNAPDAIPTAQNEEHLTLTVADVAAYPIGRVLYGIPRHVCPSVSLYDKAFVIENNQVIDEWKVIARQREISV